MKNETIETAGFLVGCLFIFVVVPVLCLLAIGWFVETGFERDLTEIETLRVDAAVVDPAQAEDVIGQVTQWNQTIASTQYANTIPVWGFFISDRWEDVEPIAVPQE